MAASLQKRPKSRKHRPRISDINVTPFVDVMLVLLIIFMVTAPLMTVGVKVNLPKTQAQAIHESVEPLTVSINKEGHIFLQNTEISLDSLVPKLQAVTEAKPDTRIYIRGDQDLPYGMMMKVMGTMNSAGFSKVALVTERQDSPLQMKASKMHKQQ